MCKCAHSTTKHISTHSAHSTFLHIDVTTHIGVRLLKSGLALQGVLQAQQLFTLTPFEVRQLAKHEVLAKRLPTVFKCG